MSVRVVENAPTTTNVVCEKNQNKKFLNLLGIFPVALEDRRTVISKWYSTVCLSRVLIKIRPGGRIILDHDNARAHTADRMNEYLNAQYIEMMDYSAYSPDLIRPSYFQG